MPKPLPIYLHTLQKQSALSQGELAFLLKTSSAMLSKLGRLERRPSASVVIGVEIIFGAASRDAFPALYDEVEVKIMKQASILFARLEAKKGAGAKEKREMLLEMIKRLPG